MNLDRCHAPAHIMSCQHSLAVVRDDSALALLLMEAITVLDNSVVEYIRVVRLNHIMEPAQRLDQYRVDGEGDTLFTMDMNNLFPEDPAAGVGAAPASAAAGDEVPVTKLFGDTSDDEPPLPKKAVPRKKVQEFASLLGDDAHIFEMLGVDPSSVSGPIVDSDVDPDDSDCCPDRPETSSDEDVAGDVGVPDAALVPIADRPFPAQPHNLATICAWGRDFSTLELLSGLRYMGLTSVGWRVTLQGQFLGTLYCRNGEVLIARCAHQNITAQPSASSNGRAVKAKLDSCRCSLRLRRQTTVELRASEAQLVMWLIAGSVLSASAHLSLAHEIERAG